MIPYFEIVNYLTGAVLAIGTLRYVVKRYASLKEDGEENIKITPLKRK